MSDLLDIRDLRVSRSGSATPIVSGVNISVDRGRVLGIVGETGAGKTLTVRGMLGALPDGLVATTASASFDGRSLSDLTEAMAQLRGQRIGVVVQDPLGALPPIQSVGSSLVNLLRTHRKMSRRAAVERISRALTDVGLSNVAGIMRSRPHELSGGMAQRVVIAAAFMTDPDLIVADEPTTALDPTVQAQILTLLRAQVIERNAGAVIITHDIGVVAQYCTDVMVLFGGTVRESGTVDEVLLHPQDAYTRELLASLPDPLKLSATAGERESKAIIEVSHVTKSYRRGKPPVLHDIDLVVPAGKTVAIVGESGAGKSTLVRAILKLIPIDSGTITFQGRDVTRLTQGAFRASRQSIQVVYQNPTAALNPRLSIRRLIEEPLLAFPQLAPTAASRRSRIDELVASVRLDPVLLDRYPPQLSGGQKQRVAIARALATNPSVIVLDEPTASLDLSVRRHVVDLLADLQRTTGVAYVLVSHDFSTVRSLAHDVIVLYKGAVVESGPAGAVLKNPSHEYTRQLLAAELSTTPPNPASQSTGQARKQAHK